VCTYNSSLFFSMADVITLSSGGSILRAWNLPDGQLVWESILKGSNPSKIMLIVPVCDYHLNTSEFPLTSSIAISFSV